MNPIRLLCLACLRLTLRGFAFASICFGLSAAEAQPCSSYITNFSPSVTRVIGTVAAGTVWTGSIVVVASGCAANVKNTNITGAFGTTPRQTSIAGVYIASNGTPTGSYGSGCSGVQGVSTSSSVVALNAHAGTCSFTATFPIIITKTAGTYSGTLGPNSLYTSSYVYFGTYTLGPGWLSTTVSGSPSVPLTNTLSLSVETVTCTVSTSSVTFSLPTVSTSALASAGSVAGSTPFTLTLTGCGAMASAYVATANWAFTPGPASNLISNTAASPAANVYVQILDSSMTPVINGGTSTIASVSASGSYSATHYARYYSTGAAGSGGVKGMATFTMTYN
ncbi:hypothetical protein [Roseateles sp.]|uniref:fimbrial protein n=1 Tax=Roseateles sp. TaxID=1971397 RepID=UPI002E0A8693|nr:hypothetical protein [Roseateles sp.]